MFAERGGVLRRGREERVFAERGRSVEEREGGEGVC